MSKESFKKVLAAVVLLGMVAGTATLTSCKKEETITNQNKTMSIQEVNVGYYHNLLLDYVYDTILVFSETEFDIFAEILGNYLLRVNNDLEKTYIEDIVEHLVTMNEEEYFGEKFSSITGLSPSTAQDLETITDYLSDNCNASSTFNSALSNYILSAYSDTTSRYVLSKFNTAFASNMTGDDLALKNCFYSVLSGSYQFWTTANICTASDESKVIINDAIGAILGSVFGPWGSVILATAISVATEEEVNDQNNNNNNND